MNPSGGTLGSPSAAKGTITDNDDAQTFVPTDPAPVPESEDSVEIPVSIQPSGKTVEMAWRTISETAVRDHDYIQGRGTLIFAPGETSKTVAIGLVDDQIAEGDETFRVEFVVPLNIEIPAEVRARSATVTIEDDETAPEATLTLDPASIRESDDPHTVGRQNMSRVTIADDEPAPKVKLVLTPDSIGEDKGRTTVTAFLDRPSSAETTVTVEAEPVLPAPGKHFTQNGTVLTIPKGYIDSTGTVTIEAVDNEVAAPAKRVTVSGTAENAQHVEDPDDVTLTITDNDSP